MTVSVDLRGLMAKTAGARVMPKKVMIQAYQYFHDITPIRSGRARRSTTLIGNTIEAWYPYAERLDTGYSSQAPRGMTQPTTKEIDKLVRAELRKNP